MARSQINLNRFRKIYPQLRKSPVWWPTNVGNQVEAAVITLTSGVGSYTTSLFYNSPVAIATPEDNVNVWISSLTPVGDGTFIVEVTASDTSFSGDVHVHVGENNV